jgi:sulfofructose kinase
MKVLVIGKPSFNVILPLESFVLENTKTSLALKEELIGGSSVYAACLLAKWGVDVSYTGVVGGDQYGTLIKNSLESYKVNTKFLEINYEKKTSMNYILINKTNGSSTQIYVDNGVMLTKYKYDFVPDVILMDGTDVNGSLAALNNFPMAITILLANKVNETIYDISKRCKYVIANSNFAKALTKMDIEINRSKSLVNLFQKIKDLNKAEYVVTLRDNGMLYVSNRQVKMLPAVKVNVVDDTNAGSVFFGAFAYGVINNYDADIRAKIANTAAALSLTKIGITSIPDLNEVLNLIGVKEEVVPNENQNTEVQAK